MRRLLSLAVIILLALSPAVAGAAWTATGGGNHEGQDWTISANTDVGGRHYNIGTFIVQPGFTANVQTRPGGTDITVGNNGIIGVSTNDATAMVVHRDVSLTTLDKSWVEVYDSSGILILGGWARLGSSEVLDGEMVPNSTFESGITGWSAYNSGVLSQESGGHTGSYSLKVAEGGAGYPGAEDNTNPLDIGDLYYFSLYIKGLTGGTINNFYLYQLDGSIFQDFTCACADWTLFRAYMAATQTSALIKFGANISGGSGGYFFADDVSLRKVINPGPTDLKIFKDATFKVRGCAILGDGNPKSARKITYYDSAANFEIKARDISIEGAINADGKGHLGGAGGAGVYAGGCGGACSSCSGSSSAGGQGTNGSGPWPGAAGSPGSDAGYMAANSNGDTTTTDFIAQGSGGGGGRAGNSCKPNCNYNCPTNCSCGNEAGANRCRGGLGGGNAHGGGAVMLIASNSLGITGSVTTKGLDSTPGSSGSSDTCGTGYGGYASGAGAGGGILLKCSGTGGLKISGTVDSRGGDSSTTNFGSIKAFALPGRVDFTSANIYGGHQGAGGYGFPLLSETLAAPFFIF